VAIVVPLLLTHFLAQKKICFAVVASVLIRASLLADDDPTGLCQQGCTGELISYPSTTFTYQPGNGPDNLQNILTNPNVPYTIGMLDNSDLDYVTVYAPAFSYDTTDPGIAVDTAFGEAYNAWADGETTGTHWHEVRPPITGISNGVDWI
jgi:hypothetical protein